MAGLPKSSNTKVSREGPKFEANLQRLWLLKVVGRELPFYMYNFGST